MHDSLVRALGCAFDIRSLAGTLQLVRLDMEGGPPPVLAEGSRRLAVLMDVVSSRADTLVALLNSLEADVIDREEGGQGEEKARQ